MTPDERERSERIDRHLEFLAKNQAQLTAQQAQFTVQQAKLSADLDRLKQVVELHSAQIAQQGVQIAEVGSFVLRIGRIVEEQGRHFDRFATGVDERLERLAEAQERTDARLNTLITVVERYFSNGHQ